MFERVVENIIREAMAKGEFKGLVNAGKRLDLEAYFQTPEDVRLMYSVLQNAGIAPRQVELLGEIASLSSEMHLAKPGADLGKQKERLQRLRLELSLLQEHDGRSRRAVRQNVGR